MHSQMVRHQTITLESVGSNPTAYKMWIGNPNEKDISAVNRFRFLLNCEY